MSRFLGVPIASCAPLLLHRLFEAQAEARPAAAAVTFGDDEATYADLEGRANRLARHLRGRRVGRGSLVAMLLPRSVDTYAALLGILKAGAAYVPIDPDQPAGRAAQILEDSGAGTLVTTGGLAERHAAFGGLIVRVDADRDAIAAESSARLRPAEVGVGPRDLCYVIYTSGSTGRPKGVMIEHRSAYHLVRAEGRIFGVRAEDRVFQGASLSFDLSVEEIWLAFHAGATLVAATPAMARSGPDLSRLLTGRGVTVLSCVPTLLSMIAEDVPTLRLLILGGETCPEGLVTRWARPGRRVVNTYGPTETTVIASHADLSPGRPVTIGRALPGYRIRVLDDALKPVPRGEVGEICIGGIGVARGYLGLAEQTADRFVPDPFRPAGQAEARIYRTGDLGRIDAEGNLRFVGRADAQVKIRGVRVELSEIESVLQGDGVLAAACALREDVPGLQQLVAYVVPRPGGRVNEEALRSYLRERLPAYMVPAVIEPLPDLPRLPNGKIDRASLPAPRARGVARRAGGARPRTDTERRIARVWEALFHPQPVSVDDHFFLDLGGHSLLAARMVSELRKDRRFTRLSVAHLYEHPTITALASTLDAAPDRPRTTRSAGLTAAARGRPRPGERGRHFRAGLLQAGGLYFVFGFEALQWVTPYLVYFLLLAGGRSMLGSALWAAAGAMAVFPLLLLVALAAKWLVLGRIRAGRHPLWGGYYLRWWFVRNLISALPLNHLCGTPLLSFVYRLFGARIGKDVHLETDDLAAFDLISIGDGTSIDDTASLLGCTVEEGELVLGPVQVGRGCLVGTRSVLREHTAMEDGARLDDLSLLPRGARVPRGETWAGSPARRVAGPIRKTAPARGPIRRAATIALYAGLVLVLPILPLAAFLPGVTLLTQIDPIAQPLLYLAAAPPVGASFVVLLTIGTVLVKWLLVGRVRAGTYPVHGGFYVRKWIVDRLLALSLDVVGSLHATLYLAPWYRALGARLGRFVELSTATSTTPDLLEIGDGGTVADEVSFGAARVERGWMTLAATRLGRRAFVGNGAVLPPGTTLGDRSLVGVLSIPPAGDRRAARSGTCWLGSPPILLPRRQPSAPFSEQRTFSPTRKLRVARGAFEILRVTLPPAGFIFVTTSVIATLLELRARLGIGAALGLLPVVYAACGALVALAVAVAKWAIMGRFRPFERPLWCAYVWRLELVNALYEFLVTPLLLEALQGTPLLPWYFRMLGARIGRRTYFHTTGLIEFDLVEVGDRAVVNEDCVLQTHLFEDRVLKASGLRVGHGCELGTGSVVLYDSVMEDGARLDALSLLMKGETLRAGTAWAGVPASWQVGARPRLVADPRGRRRAHRPRARHSSEAHAQLAQSSV